MSGLVSRRTRGMDWMESGLDFGERCPELLAKYDPNTHSWKTVQISLIEDSIESLQTLPRWGMTVAGALWGLTPWVRPTKETECGLSEKFPTPNAWDGTERAIVKRVVRQENQADISSHSHQALCVDSPEWWSTEPRVGRVANGVASRVDRLKAIGNGQVPFCAATAWRILTKDWK